MKYIVGLCSKTARHRSSPSRSASSVRRRFSTSLAIPYQPPDRIEEICQLVSSGPYASYQPADDQGGYQERRGRDDVFFIIDANRVNRRSKKISQAPQGDQ